MADREVRHLINDVNVTASDYVPNEMGIDPRAWDYILLQSIDPKTVFAHPKILHSVPKSSLHYRGIAILSLKTMSEMKFDVPKWESGEKESPEMVDCNRLAICYNRVISKLVLDKDDWSLEDGERNIIATGGITADGQSRNRVGLDGEKLVHCAMLEWLDTHETINMTEVNVCKEYRLNGNNREITMKFASEPDVAFLKDPEDPSTTLAIIEIKSGRDPAGALERLGAMSKSFDNVPATTNKFVIFGVITPELEIRLQDMTTVTKFFHMDYVLGGGKSDFMKEIFHDTLHLYVI